MASGLGQRLQELNVGKINAYKVLYVAGPGLVEDALLDKLVPGRVLGVVPVINELTKHGTSLPPIVRGICEQAWDPADDSSAISVHRH